MKRNEHTRNLYIIHQNLAVVMKVTPQELRCVVAERNTHENTVAATDLTNALSGNAVAIGTWTAIIINVVHTFP